ncbi:MAG: flagellar basal body L-ring protein FlgH [Planctomycetes bacterium]|nr:flagellar basal body L-ring protein FlgH [Planctomycetota bacterium]
MKYASLILLALIASFAASSANAQALWMDGSEDEVDYFKPYEAPRHHWSVHDLVMIRIDINSRATRTLTNDVEREFSIDAGLDEYLRLAAGFSVVPGDGVERNIAADSSIELENEAKGSRRSTFNDVIMARVVEVMPNYDTETGRGNLRIVATRAVKMNGDEETTTLTGEIAAHMIGTDDSIPINRVADLRLVQESDGRLEEGSKPGWLASILISVWPF